MKNTIVEKQLKKKVWQLVLPEKSCATLSSCRHERDIMSIASLIWTSTATSTVVDFQAEIWSVPRLKHFDPQGTEVI